MPRRVRHLTRGRPSGLPVRPDGTVRIPLFRHGRKCARAGRGSSEGRSLPLFSRFKGLALVAALSASCAAAQEAERRLLQDAVALLPPEWSFPLDARHLVVIHDYRQFSRSLPELALHEDLRETGQHKFGFVLNLSWPIYLNLDGYEHLVARYDRPDGKWVACLIASVLVHEQVHARGDGRESGALLEELLMDRRFARQGRLPPDTNLPLLAEQYLLALEAERALSQGRAAVVAHSGGK